MELCEHGSHGGLPSRQVRGVHGQLLAVHLWIQRDVHAKALLSRDCKPGKETRAG